MVKSISIAHWVDDQLQRVLSGDVQGHGLAGAAAIHRAAVVDLDIVCIDLKRDAAVVADFVVEPDIRYELAKLPVEVVDDFRTRMDPKSLGVGGAVERDVFAIAGAD